MHRAPRGETQPLNTALKNFRARARMACGPRTLKIDRRRKSLRKQRKCHSYLYVILDIYSRYVVGWMLASRENADLAKRLIHDSI